MTDQQRLLGIREAAGVLGVSPDSVRRLITHGGLKSVRVLRRVMIPRAEIEKLCTPQQQGSHASGKK